MRKHWGRKLQIQKEKSDTTDPGRYWCASLSSSEQPQMSFRMTTIFRLTALSYSKHLAGIDVQGYVKAELNCTSGFSLIGFIKIHQIGFR